MTTTISCLCGASWQTVNLKPGCWADASLCHCYACRHVTGQLFTSYVGIVGTPSVEGLRDMRRYETRGGGDSSSYACVSVSEESARWVCYYFCRVCGCHVFRCVGREGGELLEWEVATGVIIDSPGVVAMVEEDGDEVVSWEHKGVDGTGDGGLFVWLNGKGGKTGGDISTHLSSPLPTFRELDSRNHDNTADILQASCHCDNISFSITRPHPSISTAPRSGFPDLMYPYHSTPKSVISNPDDIKWWLRSTDRSSCSGHQRHHLSGRTSEGLKDKHQAMASETNTPFPTHYLSGTCACRSCRLSSGFEIQTWAFIPRENILMHLYDNDGSSQPQPGQTDNPPRRRRVPLTFPPFPPTPPDHDNTDTNTDTNTTHDSNPSPNLPPRTNEHLPLKSYESTPGVIRESCPTCGATIFWHDKYRPDLIDVSVGLFHFVASNYSTLSKPDGGGLSRSRSSGDEDGGSGRKGEAGGSGHGEGVGELRGGNGAGDGVRQESWLVWHTDRVSFSEDVDLDRKGGCAEWARKLVGELEVGLKEHPN